MRKQILILFVVLAIAVVSLMSGGFVSFGQFDSQKIGDEVVEDVQEAAGQTSQDLAAGTAVTVPVEESGEEAVALEEIPEDALRDAISAVNEFNIFAGSASKVVRNYISKIKIRQRQEDLVFEPGKEPWMSDKAEIRYSPFDPETHQQKALGFNFIQQAPYLPPMGTVVSKINLDQIIQLINLKMTTKQGDEYVAMAEIAGQAVRLVVGSKLDPEHKFLPPEIDIEIVEISLNSILVRSGSDVKRIPFAGPVSTEDKPFEIQVIK